VFWRDACERIPDPSGQIWNFRAFFFIADQLRWQELQRRWRRGPDLSLNKVASLSLWRLLVLTLFRGVNQPPESISVKPPWWWCDERGFIGKASFNKRISLWRCGFLMLGFFSLPGHGGLEMVWSPVLTCSKGRDGGFFQVLELNHDEGIFASAILCRHGGSMSTSSEEALLPRRGCSKLPSLEVMCSPWLGGGPRRRSNAGRGLPSSWPLFLGGDAWRTPAIGGGDTQGRNRFSFPCCRVFFVKSEGLSSNTRLARASDARTSVQFVPATL
jgi:hypothetical protein